MMAILAKFSILVHTKTFRRTMIKYKSKQRSFVLLKNNKNKQQQLKEPPSSYCCLFSPIWIMAKILIIFINFLPLFINIKSIINTLLTHQVQENN